MKRAEERRFIDCELRFFLSDMVDYLRRPPPPLVPRLPPMLEAPRELLARDELPL